MSEPFVGSEAVANGEVLKSALRTHYTRLFRDVYANPGLEQSPIVRARAGWIWSRRRGIVAGLTASAVYGARWIEPSRPLEILHTNRNPLPGIVVRGGRIDDDEVTVVDGVPVTTPARTALDLACWYSLDEAVAAIDALLGATDLKVAEVERLAERCRGRRGIRRAREAFELVDGGSQSPRETWLRLLLIRAGFPRPQTQIPVCDAIGEVFAYLDMGWEDVKVAAEYDGEQHRTDQRQYRWDLRRQEKIERLGWINVRVVAGDRPMDVIRAVAAARALRASR
ncbi:type IV toxin-antitoxin system AbiEi family antitoxin [Mycobacterium sp. Marseille-P9652]|uniref:type IV toxin-antitoxin system AbiEi family antitoxin n=1 Tax=Mycobacterium sp. Marseille-P9652 TaxID=2654950 RepID=UPI0012E8B942|nr:type IV toxin-antitoxin system AbiEi family antitoxin [Mycobacterium sp. Marseille-P9652]